MHFDSLPFALFLFSIKDLLLGVLSLSHVNFTIHNIDTEIDYSHSDFISLQLSMVSQKDFHYVESRYTVKDGFQKPIGILNKPFETMKNLSFNLRIYVHDKKFVIKDQSEEKVLRPILFGRPEEMVFISGKFTLTYKANFSCSSEVKLNDYSCFDDFSPRLDSSWYRCSNVTVANQTRHCRSLSIGSDYFNCIQPSTSTTTTTTTTTTASTLLPTATKITTTQSSSPRFSTSTTTTRITSSSLTDFILNRTGLEEKQQSNDKSNKTLIIDMNPDNICIPRYLALGILIALVCIVLINTICLVIMRQNHGSFHELFCGSTDSVKKDQDGTEDLYSKPWDDREHSTLEHLFESMPDIRANIRQSEHIYAVPQNLNNLVQFRNNNHLDSQLSADVSLPEDLTNMK